MAERAKAKFFKRLFFVMSLILVTSFLITILMNVFPVAGIIFLSMIICGLLLFFLTELYYRTQKQNQIVSPYIHLSTILLAIIIGIIGLIVFLFYIIKFSHDAEAAIIPFVLAPFVLAGCGLAGIIVGFVYRGRDYRLIFGTGQDFKKG